MNTCNRLTIKTKQEEDGTMVRTIEIKPSVEGAALGIQAEMAGQRYLNR